MFRFSKALQPPLTPPCEEGDRKKLSSLESRKEKLPSFKRRGWGWFCLCMLTCAPAYVCAQTLENQKDTISKKSANKSKEISEETLQTVEVSGFSLQKYSVGLKKIALDSTNLALYTGRSVGDFLMMQTPIYIKEYGAGMLASASFRGTGAGHTAFVWNGVSIGSPTLGEVDFSQMPMFIFDNLSVQFGGASSLLGTDAIGGSIVVEGNIPAFKSANKYFSPKIFLQQKIGSFGRNNTNLGLILESKNIISQTKIYHSTAKNNFFVGGKENKHASARNAGFLQEFAFKLPKNQYILFKTWYHNAFIELANQTSTQKDQNLRIMADYFKETGNIVYNAKLAYIKDIMYFNEEKTQTERFVGTFGADITPNNQLGSKLNIRLGGNINYILMNVDNYLSATNQKQPTETRNDVFALLRWQAKNRLAISANLRQTFVSGFKGAFAPSFGVEYQLKNSIQTTPSPSLGRRGAEKVPPLFEEGLEVVAKSPSFEGGVRGGFDTKATLILLKSNISHNYRVPTLNSRYWQPGGNPDIRPEVSYNAEIGISATHKRNNFEFKSNLTTYQNYVKDWILWHPNATNGNFWTPDNLREVRIRGAEIDGAISYKNNQNNNKNKSLKSAKIGISYAYTQSTNLKGTSENDKNSEGKQLPYVPFNRVTAFFEVIFGKNFISGQTQYTDVRFLTTDNSEFVKPFVVANLNFGRNMNINIKNKQQKINVSMQINNIFNLTYTNVGANMMPPRSFEVNLSIVAP